MSDITEFLLARIAEDEEKAKAAADTAAGRIWAPHHGTYVYGLCVAGSMQSAAQAQHVATHNPARILGECAVKRRIVTGHFWDDSDPSEEYKDDAWMAGAGRVHESVLRMLAAIYRGHPDYREEWKTLTEK